MRRKHSKKKRKSTKKSTGLSLRQQKKTKGKVVKSRQDFRVLIAQTGREMTQIIFKIQKLGEHMAEVTSSTDHLTIFSVRVMISS